MASKVAQLPSARLSSRHRPSGLNSRFTCQQATFSEYISSARSLIMQARKELEPAELKKIVEGNAPFELQPKGDFLAGKLKPYRRGILLTHGLTDSPYFMRHLAEFFQERGFRVLAILLPGHGTQPGDLLKVRWGEWAKSVAFGVEQISIEVDEIYLGGYSAGGALSLYHSLKDSRVKGLFLFAPALKISPKAAYAHWHQFYSWLAPSARWVNVCPDIDRFKYESFPKNAAAQMYALTQALRKKMGNEDVKIPVFTVMCQDDATADTDAIVSLLERSSHTANRSIYYFSDANKIPHWKIKNIPECVNGVFPEKKIIGPAHTAIVLPSNDSFYGEAGEYCNCIHYYPDDMKKFADCQAQATQLFQGEITRKNLQIGTLKRLMHNPNYSHLKQAMKQFIDNLPA
jgi:esterase/lipase